MLDYLDPAGRTLRVAGKNARRLQLWQSRFSVNTPLDGRVPDAMRSRTLTVADAGNHDDWLTNSIGGKLVGEYSLSGGTLQIWAPDDPERQGLARWLGAQSEVTCFLPFQRWEDHEFVLAYFSGVAFEEAELGVVATPMTADSEVTVLDVSSFASGVGLFEFRDAMGLSSVPNWQGANIASGEVWKIANPGDPEVVPHLVIAATDVIASITPQKQSGLASCLKFAQGLETMAYLERGAA